MFVPPLSSCLSSFFLSLVLFTVLRLLNLVFLFANVFSFFDLSKIGQIWTGLTGTGLTGLA